MNMPSSADEPLAYRLQGMPFDAQLARLESSIRVQPAAAAHRWALFQLMCVSGDWARAIQQLQTWAKLEPRQARAAQAYRDLIRAERWRARVVAGREHPGFVLAPPAWIHGLLRALHLAAAGQTDEADGARERALDEAPLVVARGPQGRVTSWIADSDSRFGPVCEVITAGHYRWIPFSDLVSWQVSPPTAAIDLVWAQCVLGLVDGSVVRGFMPARYPGSELAAEPLRFGRETIWREAGRASVVALGRKTWATGCGDFDLFELERCEFGARVLDALGAAESVDARA